MPRPRFPKGVAQAKDLPRCQHLLPVSSHSQANSISSTLSDQANTTQQEPSYVTLIEPSQAQHNLCRCVALRGEMYCKWHIKDHPTEYQAWLDKQELIRAKRRKITTIGTTTNTPQIVGKYNFADQDLRERYARQLSSGSRLLNLTDDMALLIALLERLVNDGKYKTGEVIRLIDTQRKLIATMDQIRKTQANILTHDKADLLIKRIIDILDKRIGDADTRRLIGQDFLMVAGEFKGSSEQGGAGNE